MNPVRAVRASGGTDPLGPLNRVARKGIDARIARVETIFALDFHLLELGIVLRRTHRRGSSRNRGEIRVRGLWSVVRGSWSVLSTEY